MSTAAIGYAGRKDMVIVSATQLSVRGRGPDPHSDFPDAAAFHELQVDTQGKVGGLCIEVGVEDGVIRVVSPIEDTPAFKAGIKNGDLIVKIDATATRGMPLSTTFGQMRGKPGRQVLLQ